MSKLANKAYRDAFGTEVQGSIARQIWIMRMERGWSQVQLARRAGMRQARISMLEDPNRPNLSIRTLKRIAKAFDVALEVRFISFGELTDTLENAPGFTE